MVFQLFVALWKKVLKNITLQEKRLQCDCAPNMTWRLNCEVVINTVSRRKGVQKSTVVVIAQMYLKRANLSEAILHEI